MRKLQIPQNLTFGNFDFRVNFKAHRKCKRANLKTGVSRNQSTPKFPKNKHFLPPDTHTYVCVLGGKKCYFSEILACFAFLKHPS